MTVFSLPKCCNWAAICIAITHSDNKTYIFAVFRAHVSTLGDPDAGTDGQPDCHSRANTRTDARTSD